MSKPQMEQPPEAAAHGEAIAVDPQGELKAALAEAQQEAASNRDGYLRMAAEMENLRKRAQRDLENAHKYALERFLAELLPVQDSLELGLAAADAGEVSFKEGMQITRKMLSTVLERAGIRKLNPAKGDNFDPELQEAMALQESADVAPGTVLQTMQYGYQLNGRLLRPARVIVAKAPGSDA